MICDTCGWCEVCNGAGHSCCRCGSELALATGICTGCGHDAMGYWDDDIEIPPDVYGLISTHEAGA